MAATPAPAEHPRLPIPPRVSAGHRPGFTLVELLAGIAILAILVAIGISVFSRMSRKGAEAKSVSNLRQITTGFLNYTADNGGSFPFDVMYSTATNNSMRLYLGLTGWPVAGRTSILTCPVMHSLWPSTAARCATFALNTYAGRYTRPSGVSDNNVQIERGRQYPRFIHSVPRPGKMMLMGNFIPTWDQGKPGFYSFNLSMPRATASANDFPSRYLFSGGTQPFSFLDGHIEMLKPEDIKERSKSTSDEASNLFWRGGFR